MSQPAPARTLELVESAKLSTLLGEADDTRLEASGICRVDQAFYVIFDNLPDIACIAGLAPLGHASKRWRQTGRTSTGFEDIAFDPAEKHFYVLVEAVKTKSGAIQPMVEEYDVELNFLERREVDFELESANKGFEGIAHIHRGGEAYLLLLCEGNECRGGKAGRTPGGGRIHVFRKGKHAWKPVTTLKLPGWLPFQDYAALDVYEEWVLVASQEGAAVWVGRMTDDGVPLEDEGGLFEFPRDAAGDVIFCNVEGVVWAGENVIVAVSDRMKRGAQADKCSQQEQSIHVFRVPG